MKKFPKVLLIVLIIICLGLIIINIYQYTKNKSKLTIYKIEAKTKNDISVEGAFFKTNNSLFLGIIINTKRFYDEDTYQKIELYSEKENELLKTEYSSKYMILNDYDLYHNYLDKNIKLTLKIYYKETIEEEIKIEFQKVYQNSLKKTLENLKLKSSKEKIIEKVNNTKNKLMLNMLPQANFYIYEFGNDEVMTYIPFDNNLFYYRLVKENEYERYYLDFNKLELLYIHSVNGEDVLTYYYALDGDSCQKEDCQDYKVKKENFDKLILKIIS